MASIYDNPMQERWDFGNCYRCGRAFGPREDRYYIKSMYLCKDCAIDLLESGEVEPLDDDVMDVANELHYYAEL